MHLPSNSLVPGPPVLQYTAIVNLHSPKRQQPPTASGDNTPSSIRTQSAADEEDDDEDHDDVDDDDDGEGDAQTDIRAVGDDGGVIVSYTQHADPDGDGDSGGGGGGMPWVMMSQAA